MLKRIRFLHRGACLTLSLLGCFGLFLPGFVSTWSAPSWAMQAWALLSAIALFLVLASSAEAIAELLSGSRSQRAWMLGGLCLVSTVFLTEYWLRIGPEPPFWSAWPLLATWTLVSASSNRVQRFIVNAYLFAASAESGYAVVTWLTGKEEFFTPNFGPRASGTLGNPLLLGCAAMLALFLALHELDRAHHSQHRWLAGAAILMNLAALVLTFDRGYMIGAAIGFSAILFSKGRIRLSRTVQLGLATVPLLLIVTALMVRTGTDIRTIADDRSLIGRAHVWSTAQEIIRQHWIFGTGPGNYYQAQRVAPALAEFNPRNLEPDNLYLAFLASFGFAGAFLLTLGLAVFLRFSPLHNIRSPSNTILTAALISLLIAGIANTSIGFPLTSAGSQLLAVVLGFCGRPSSPQPPVPVNNTNLIT